MEGKKYSKTFLKVLERHNMQNQSIFELYTDDYKSKYSSNFKDILKSIKKFCKKLYTKFLSKISNRKKISNEHFNFCGAKISLDKIIKSVNFEANSKSPGNNGLAAEFYKHFSNELAHALLDIYAS